MITIISPHYSFIQFNNLQESHLCNHYPFGCLPVADEGDISFQIIATTETEEEANYLCNNTQAIKVRLQHANDCENTESFIVEYTPNLKFERLRTGAKDIALFWQHGLPNITGLIDIGDCFVIQLILPDETVLCSNCFERVEEDCYTTVIEYASPSDNFGFVYCGVNDELDNIICEWEDVFSNEFC